jgi:hypothetical protein
LKQYFKPEAYYFIDNYMYLLQVGGAVAGGVLSGNGVIAEGVSKSWDEHWVNFFQGGLYTAVNQSMLGFALLFFVYSSVMTLIAWNNTGDDSNWNRMIAPLLVVAFLVNGGALTQTMILGVRSASNVVNTQIIKSLQISQYYNGKLKNIVSTQKAINEIKAEINICQSMALPEAKDTCLGKLENLLEAKRKSGEIRDKNILDNIGNTLGRINSARSNAASAAGGVAGVPGSIVGGVVGGLSGIVGELSTTIGRAALSPALGVAFLFLMAITSAVQNMVEGSLLLTSLLAPIYITGGLLPDGKQSIIALCTSFWTIINYKICYTIILGLTSQLVFNGYEDDGNEGLVLALISAIFAPILAGILAAGGGMGFANAAAGAATSAISFAGNIGMSAMSGGGSTIASIIGSKLTGK